MQIRRGRLNSRPANPRSIEYVNPIDIGTHTSRVPDVLRYSVYPSRGFSKRPKKRPFLALRCKRWAVQSIASPDTQFSSQGIRLPFQLLAASCPICGISVHICTSDTNEQQCEAKSNTAAYGLPHISGNPENCDWYEPLRP